ncbi:hypothetical protein Tco_0793392, partial [Tanacetum coccineum]
SMSRPEFVWEKTWHVMAADVENVERWNGYLRKGRKTKPKRQNRTRNGKAWKRQSKVQVSKSQPKSTPKPKSQEKQV